MERRNRTATEPQSERAQIVLKAIRERRSIRKYEPVPIPAGELEKLKTAILWAPSAGNLQSRRFFFVTRERARQELARAAGDHDFIGQAPLIVVGCADRRIEKDYLSRGWSLYAVQDVSAAVENLLLMAHSLGLGGCWVGSFNEAEVKATLGLPEHLRPVALVSIGVPAEQPAAPPRPELSSIVTDVA
jgi:nitroreductase